MEEEDFLEVQNAYQIIENTGFQVVVPCPGKRSCIKRWRHAMKKRALRRP